MVGRELDMIELKRRINELSCRLGRESPYALDFLDAPVPGPGAEPVAAADRPAADAPV
jgi:hypothetical protein